MAKFKIEYTETSVGFFDVEAENETEAIEEFWNLVCKGKIDLLDTEMVESNMEVCKYEE